MVGVGAVRRRLQRGDAGPMGLPVRAGAGGRGGSGLVQPAGAARRSVVLGVFRPHLRGAGLLPEPVPRADQLRLHRLDERDSREGRFRTHLLNGQRTEYGHGSYPRGGPGNNICVYVERVRFGTNDSGPYY